MKPAATSIDARRPGAAHPNSSAPAVDIVGLTKTFGRGRSATRALDGLDLSVAPGEVAGFLGPNGAGKSTTLRILLGMIRAEEPGAPSKAAPWSGSGDCCAHASRPSSNATRRAWSAWTASASCAPWPARRPTAGAGRWRSVLSRTATPR